MLVLWAKGTGFHSWRPAVYLIGKDISKGLPRPDFLGRVTCHKVTLKSSQCKTCELGIAVLVPREAELSFLL